MVTFIVDTLVSCNSGNLWVSVYNKPTHTNLYLNYTSNYQMSHKESVLITVRAVYLVSGENDWEIVISHKQRSTCK